MRVARHAQEGLTSALPAPDQKRARQWPCSCLGRGVWPASVRRALGLGWQWDDARAQLGLDHIQGWMCAADIERRGLGLVWLCVDIGLGEGRAQSSSGMRMASLHMGTGV